jgi:hypothetical protein
MSMEIYALSDKQLASIADWQNAIEAADFSLTLSTDRTFSSLCGFLPIQMAGAQTGFECDHWDPHDVQHTYSDAGFDRQWRYCLAFRWGADLKACLAAYMAAAAYAAATDGVVLDCEQGKLLNPQEAAQVARDIEAQLPAMEQALHSAMEKLKSQSRE